MAISQCVHNNGPLWHVWPTWRTTGHCRVVSPEGLYITMMQTLHSIHLISQALKITYPWWLHCRNCDYLILGRMRTPVREAFSYGIRQGIRHIRCDSMKYDLMLHWITMNMPYPVPYPVWKCLPYGSTHPPYYLLHNNDAKHGQKELISYSQGVWERHAQNGNTCTNEIF